MSFLQDNFIPFFKKKDLRFRDQNKEAEDVYTFRFEKDPDLTWKAGQYGLFSITHKKIKNPTRPLCVASAPAENTVQITTRIGDDPSDFKKALLELKQGMKLSMRGPVGPFYLQDNRPALLIAGGIGITPFRSIVKQMEAEGKTDAHAIHLLYMNSNKAFIYQSELDAISNHTAMKMTYIDGRDQLYQEINEFIGQYNNEAKYYIAGPQSMVDSVFTCLQNGNITKQNIVKDAFFGY